MSLLVVLGIDLRGHAEDQHASRRHNLVFARKSFYSLWNVTINGNIKEGEKTVNKVIHTISDVSQYWPK
jgi:hypothetical protein